MSSISQRQTRRPTGERREEILRAAARLFQQRGYSGVGMDEIGEAVGVSGPAIYRHFAGKDDILHAIGAEFNEALVAAATAATESSDGPAHRAQSVIDAVVRVGIDHPAQLAVWLRHLWNLDGERLGDIGRRYGELQQIVVPVIAAAVPYPRTDLGLIAVRAASGIVLGAARSKSSIAAARLSELASAEITEMLTIQLPTDDPEPTGGAPQWQRSSRREQILAAALSLFRERGFRGVSLAEIGEQVGLSASAMYRHFKNKEDILATAVRRSGDFTSMRMDESLAAATDAADALERLVNGHIDVFVSNQDLVAVAMSDYNHLPEEVRAGRRTRQRGFDAEWVHCLATTHPNLNNAEAIALTHSIMGMIVEVVRSARVARVRHDLRSDLRALCTAALRGARALPPS